ncbi:unnamed protein product [Withania somnifera]
MSMWWFITALAITAFFSSPAYANDNNALQDICVAVRDSKDAVFVNGKTCKNPKLAKVDDFFFSGLNVSKNVFPKFGIAATFVGVNEMPGLNTLGISIIRVDVEPGHLFPFHTHPRASSLITILEGTLHVGFLVPDDVNFFKSRLFSKILYPGDVFVFPEGLIHFLYNVGHKKATFHAALNSQNPGLITIPSSILTSQPPIMDDILAKGFQFDKKEIVELRKRFY